MKAKVEDYCIGCGTCVAMCDRVFDFNDEGLAVGKDIELSKEDIEEVKNIIPMCPVDAIKLVEEEKTEDKKEENTK